MVEARSEGRLRAVQAALDVVADDEQRRRGAVVGAAVAVLLGPATELRERHQRDAVGPRGMQRREERVDRRRRGRPGASACQPAWSECVSKPSSSVSITRMPRFALMRCAAQHELLREVAVRHREPVRGPDPLRERHRARDSVVSYEVAERAEPGAPDAEASRARRTCARSVAVAAVDAERVADVERERRRRATRARRGAAASTIRAATRRRATRSSAFGKPSRKRPSQPVVGDCGAPPQPCIQMSHRREVAEVGGLVADAAHDRDLALVEQVLRASRATGAARGPCRRAARSRLDRERRRGGRSSGRRRRGTTMLRPSLPPDMWIATRMPSVVGDRRRRERLQASEHRAERAAPAPAAAALEQRAAAHVGRRRGEPVKTSSGRGRSSRSSLRLGEVDLGAEHHQRHQVDERPVGPRVACRRAAA